MAFWKFTGTGSYDFNQINLVAHSGYVYDFGSATPPSYPAVREGAQPLPSFPWVSDPGPASDGRITQASDLAGSFTPWTHGAALLRGQIVTSSNLAMNESQAAYGAEGTTGYTVRWPFKVVQACTDLRFHFNNWAWDGTNLVEIAAANTITTKACLKYGSLFYPVSIRGQRSVTLDPWGEIVTDPIAVELPAGAEAELQFQVLTPASGTAPRGHQGGGPGVATVAGYVTGDSVDATSGITNAFVDFWGPSAVTGTVYGAPKPQLAIFVDSIGAGLADTTAGSSASNSGGSKGGPWSWITRGINNTVPAVRIGGPGDLLQNVVTGKAGHRLAYATGASSAVMQMGTNDIASNGRTLAQLQADISTWATMMRNRGVSGLWLCTLLPRTTSTDSWATAANQTPLASESVRVAYNNWVRNTAVSALGLNGYIEVADTLETSRDSGLWKVNGSAQYATPDGIHPNSAGAILASAAWPAASVFV
jgi:lysophospholipase L1-like esterase